MRLRVYFRVLAAGYVMAREGLLGIAETFDNLPALARAGLALARLVERRRVRQRKYGDRLTSAIFRLGPSYVKLGQFLATRADVVGEEIASELSRLQDDLPAFSQKMAIHEIERQLGGCFSDHFTQMDLPVAAASIAQVHRAEIARDPGTALHGPSSEGSGPDSREEGSPDSREEGTRPSHRPVAVKILRPGVATRFRRDLEGFYLVAGLIERFQPAARRLRPRAVVETLERSVALEMDFRMEAAALSETAENVKNDHGFRVPEVIWTHTSRTLLTMEWIEGVKISDRARLMEDGHDLPLLARRLIQEFLRQAVRDGFFHADMHQGNLFVEPDGTIVAVDYGITGRLDSAERGFLARILFGFITRDYHSVARVHFDAGYVPRSQDVDVFAQAIRAIGEPIHGQDASRISMARLLSQLFDVTALFEMETQTRLIMLQKNMVVVEGVARSLDPNLDIWSAAEPVMREWMERRLGARGRAEETRDMLTSVMRAARELPGMVERVHSILADLETHSRARPGRWRGPYGGPHRGAAKTVFFVLAAAVLAAVLILP